MNLEFLEKREDWELVGTDRVWRDLVEGDDRDGHDPSSKQKQKNKEIILSERGGVGVDRGLGGMLSKGMIDNAVAGDMISSQTIQHRRKYHIRKRWRWKYIKCCSVVQEHKKKKRGIGADNEQKKKNSTSKMKTGVIWR